MKNHSKPEQKSTRVKSVTSGHLNSHKKVTNNNDRQISRRISNAGFMEASKPEREEKIYEITYLPQMILLLISFFR